MKVESVAAVLAATIPACLASPAWQAHKSVAWGPCNNASAIPTGMVCANLSVPLDYTDDDSADLQLSLYRLPATETPSRGSILINPGGPGQVGWGFIVGSGDELRALSGNSYDIVAFDPRGTANTLALDCMKEGSTELEAFENSAPISWNASGDALELIWNKSKVRAEACYQALKGVGEFYGTAFVARDMLEIVKALNEDGLLRYSGVSYGTVLGATFAAMFPGRVDKMMLDGNVNIIEWYTGIRSESGTNSEDVLDGFFSSCAKTPEGCVLANHNDTGADIKKKWDSFLAAMKNEPIVSENGNVTYDTVLNLMAESLGDPGKWAATAQSIKSIMEGDFSGLFEAPSSIQKQPPFTLDHGWAFGKISGGDAIFRSDDLEHVLPAARKINAVSPLMGEMNGNQLTDLATWKFNAKERYSGNWYTKTRSPILLLGNSYDPVTPLVSAFNTSHYFEGSAVLHQNSYGHSTMVQNSICTMKVKRAYWLNGTLPEAGTVCEPDWEPFTNKSNELWRDFV